MPTNGNDNITFQGTLGQLVVTMTNPYSGRVIEIDDPFNINNTTYDGLGGTDTLRMTGGNDALFVTDNTGMQVVQNIEVFRAGRGNDIINLADTSITLGDVTLRGNGGNDILWANEGDDVVYGGGGHDIIDGGSGDDRLYGGNGNDDITGSQGSDLLDGGRGNDILHYNDDSDWLDWTHGHVTWNLGSPGNTFQLNPVFLENYNRSTDAFVGGRGTDTIQLTDGGDSIFLQDTFTVNPLGANSDARIVDVEIIRGGAGDDVINMTSNLWTYGDVQLYGEDGDDFLWGNAGDDIIVGGAGWDHIDGGMGDDILIVGEGKDKIFSRDSGSDQIVYDTLEAGYVDAIHGFETGVGNDVLNLTDILTGYDPATSAIEDFVEFVHVGPHTRVYVDGDGGGDSFVLISVMRDVTADVSTALAEGNLVVDQSVVI